MTDTPKEAPPRAAYELLDALYSIRDHPKEFSDLEDFETMVAKMQQKATLAIEAYQCSG